MSNWDFIFVLLIIYQFKHFIADYLLQGRYMLGKFKADWGFFLPLFSHAAVHGLFTLGIVWFVNPSLWWLTLVDICIHFVVDRIKAAPHYLGRWTHQHPQFWWILGWDQMMHHLCHYYIIWVLITN